VLQGTWMFGYGLRFDKAALRTLPVGSVYPEPSGGAHFAMTGDESVTVLITGFGPTDTVYEAPPTIRRPNTEIKTWRPKPQARKRADRSMSAPSRGNQGYDSGRR
jgi:hypothetical protein